MFKHGFLCRGDVNDVIYDAECTREGQYRCTRGLIWVHTRADMGSCEQAVMVSKSQVVSGRETKNFVTISSNTCHTWPL